MTTASARLIVVAGPSRGEVIELDGPISIGRDVSSVRVIPDLALSRRHCEITLDEGVMTLRDLDSRNGTIVNGVPVHAHTLADGDQICIGDSALIFVTPHAKTTILDESTVVAPLNLAPIDSRSMHFTSHITVEHDLVGQGQAMREVYRRIGRAAPTDSTILIQGESGTGKELVARAVHASSGRALAPFIAINCAAVPEGLMESELFGHERGAFTGAVNQTRGRMEAAHTGTVFLDEIGELPLQLQAKLLRVLQERQLERVGRTRPIPIDIRVVAATNRDLDQAVKAGAFRRDLYYRLNVVSIVVPPLRDRLDDVPLLITYFVRKHARRCKRRIRGVTREARARLMGYEWPGNVRELENAVERAIVLGNDEWIGLDDLPEHVLEASPSSEPAEGYHASVTEAKRRVLRDAIERAAGNYAQAARALGLQPTYLHRLVKNLKIQKGS